MSAEKQSSSPPFRVGDFVFESWLVGDAGSHSEWRSTCGQLEVGHVYADRALWSSGSRDDPEAWAASMTARLFYWASVDGKRMRDCFANCAGAMHGAIAALAHKRFGRAACGIVCLRHSARGSRRWFFICPAARIVRAAACRPSASALARRRSGCRPSPAPYTRRGRQWLI